MRRPLPWFVAGVVLVAASMLTLYLLFHSQDEWNADVLRHCADLYGGAWALPPLPDARLYGGIAVVLALGALVAFVVAFVAAIRAARHPWIPVTAVCAVMFTVLVGGTGALMLDAPTDRGHGTDGSGLPCPEG